MFNNETLQKNNNVLKTCSKCPTGRKSINVCLGKKKTRIVVPWDSCTFGVYGSSNVQCMSVSQMTLPEKFAVICSDVVVGKTRISLQLGKTSNHGYVLELGKGGESVVLLDATLFPQIAKEVLQPSSWYPVTFVRPSR